MIDTIEFLYTSDIVYRDIRPQNLMLDYHEEHIKLINFDFAITYEINENTKKLPIAGTVTYAGYELLTCYVEASVNGQYAAFYHYERTFDLKCALNIIIYMIDKNVQVQLNAIEQLSPSVGKILRSLELWKNIKQKNEIYSHLLHLINNSIELSAIGDFKDQLEKLYYLVTKIIT
ncbi:unnamed protein product [Rotaria magnacalcarata]|uniref:Protein kinase domain-containing protein n=1 Tax=Rotaria magnacalcarata TaxID=392030 RepID=A0A820PRT5_9BILA|nr:unnamed protein product [Rotaria magnacalcarata]CAF4260109.1 unnamed protein product [Rotaria magnacalcarata]CAF4409291.1 unnamed protein product [Rotaria magnacalcarata]